jgi:pimeloyl-ACP methyl ester carboxylesterase
MTSSAREGNVRCLSAAGFHHMVYWEWGPPEAARTAVCVHGLTRNGLDFEILASALAADGWRVVCPDIAGRGGSDWLADPQAYAYPQYLADMTVLLARLSVERVSWLGTSMGGLIGMMLAAQPGTPIERLVLNDIGPFVPKAALARLADYVGADPRFADWAAAERYVRKVYAPFGDLDDDAWRRMTEISVAPADGGGLRLRYDPRIGDVFRDAPLEDVNLWEVWDRIACPVRVLRGENSDLLRPETAAEMARRGPRAEIIEIAGCGHAPALREAREVTLVRKWLNPA